MRRWVAELLFLGGSAMVAVSLWQIHWAVPVGLGGCAVAFTGLLLTRKGTPE